MAIEKKKIGHYYGYDVFAVDAADVRDSSLPNQEFTNYAIHEDFPKLIKKNEIWLDDKCDKPECNIYIEVCLRRLLYLSQGYTNKEASNKSIKYEKDLREQREHVKFNPQATNIKAYAKVYKKLYKIIKDAKRDIHVYIVDGDYVRDKYRTEYVEGGHGYVYPWIPNNEIWIDDDVKEKEIPEILEHEYYEMVLIRDTGLDYESAHDKARKMEYKMRLADMRHDITKIKLIFSKPNGRKKSIEMVATGTYNINNKRWEFDSKDENLQQWLEEKFNKLLTGKLSKLLPNTMEFLGYMKDIIMPSKQLVLTWEIKK